MHTRAITATRSATMKLSRPSRTSANASYWCTCVTQPTGLLMSSLNRAGNKHRAAALHTPECQASSYNTPISVCKPYVRHQTSNKDQPKPNLRPVYNHADRVDPAAVAAIQAVHEHPGNRSRERWLRHNCRMQEARQHRLCRRLRLHFPPARTRAPCLECRGWADSRVATIITVNLHVQFTSPSWC